MYKISHECFYHLTSSSFILFSFFCFDIDGSFLHEFIGKIKDFACLQSFSVSKHPYRAPFFILILGRGHFYLWWVCRSQLRNSPSGLAQPWLQWGWPALPLRSPSKVWGSCQLEEVGQTNFNWKSQDNYPITWSKFQSVLKVWFMRWLYFWLLSLLTNDYKVYYIVWFTCTLSPWSQSQITEITRQITD